MPSWLPVVFTVAFAIVFPLVLLHILAVASGWRQLSERFPDNDSGDDTTRAFGSAAFARGRFPISYNNSIAIRTTLRGMRFSTFLAPFTFGAMRPFFVPWTDIDRAELGAALFGDALKLRIRGYGGSITLVGRLARAVAAAAKATA